MTQRIIQHPLSYGIALALGLGLAAACAHATTITVNSTADNTSTNGHCTLREALDNAEHDNWHSDCAPGLPYDSDTIIFAPALAGSTITLTASAGGAFHLTAGQVTIVDGDVDGDGVADITLSGNDQSRLFEIDSYDTLTLQNITLSHGRTPNMGSGGAIHNSGVLTLAHATVRDSYASMSGGGIYSGGTLNIDNSVIDGNRGGSGGGISAQYNSLTIKRSTISDNLAYGDGGGIEVSGSFTMTQSTVSGNASYVDGGGIKSASQANLTNSTIQGNSASSGGGIAVPSGELELRQVTLADNNGLGGGLYLDWPASVTLDNTIIAGNKRGSYDDNCAGGGTIANSGNNLAWPTPGAACDVFAVRVADPMLGELAWNGGPTKTMLPQPGSGAVDAAPCITGGQAASVDQRGVSRPQGTNATPTSSCDMGAVEVTSVDRDRIFADGFE